MTDKCAECSEPLPNDRQSVGEARTPCVSCGSTKRRVYVSAAFTISLDLSGDLTSKPAFLTQALLIPDGDDAEGMLVQAVTLPWYRIIQKLCNDPAIAVELTSRQWEEIVAGAYKEAGFDEVKLTPRSGDYGRDIIAIKRGLGTVRVIDQVKAYKPGHLVTANDVRALMGLLHEDGAAKGFLTTTSDFAPRIRKDPLIAPLLPSRLELVNGKQLMQRLSELAREQDR